MIDAGVRPGSRGSFGAAQDRPVGSAKEPNTKVSLFETNQTIGALRDAACTGAPSGHIPWDARQASDTGGMERYESFEVGGCFNPFLLFFFYEIFFELGEVFDSEGWE